MSRVHTIDPANADAKVAPVLRKVEGAFGAVPNMFAVVANSPAALQSMWGSFAAFSTGSLGAALGEQIAVAVADRNRCRYCLAAHTVLGGGAGVSGDDMAAAQQARSSDPATQALLEFAVEIVENRGQVREGSVQRLRDHGWTDEQIVETVAQVALNLFTNYVNIALDVDVDFPEVAFKS